jgi:7,8-dihydro-6-hydroxymethylpterin dimethyltransferase
VVVTEIDFTELGATTSLCGVCKRTVPAVIGRVGRADGAVVMRKRCPEHGAAEVPVAADADWYARTIGEAPRLAPPDPATAAPVRQGCPFDCGPCAGHEQTVALPIVPITSACNLDCPICYTHNKNEGAWHMSAGELEALLGHLRVAAPERRIINITGGEPTMHPDLAGLVGLCVREGIHRVTISTHGLRFLADEALLIELGRLGARIVLSFDALDGAGNRALLGGDFLAGKRRVLALLDKHGVATTLLPVIARGHNDQDLGRLVALALDTSCVRSLELHTLTFTGQGGKSFDRAARMTPDEVLSAVERQTEGRLRVDDFVPSPAAHPLCYQVTYLLQVGEGRWVPFPRFMRRADLRALLGRGLYLEPTIELEAALADVIDRLWTGEVACDDGDAVLAALRALADAVFAPSRSEEERLREAERRTKAIYLHAHMDEETFDVARVRQCPVGVREPDGRNIPSCSYNVLYRERDARFTSAPEAPLVTLGMGARASTGRFTQS